MLSDNLSDLLLTHGSLAVKPGEGREPNAGKEKYTPLAEEKASTTLVMPEQ